MDPAGFEPASATWTECRETCAESGTVLFRPYPTLRHKTAKAWGNPRTGLVEKGSASPQSETSLAKSLCPAELPLKPKPGLDVPPGVRENPAQAELERCTLRSKSEV